MDLLVRGGGQRAGSGRAAVRDDLRSSLPPRDADPAAGDVKAFCRTTGPGTPGRRQVTPVVMTTDRAVSVPPSQSRSRQGYAAVRRTTFSARYLRGPERTKQSPCAAGR
jgi:hypothetical protein